MMEEMMTQIDSEELVRLSRVFSNASNFFLAEGSEEFRSYNPVEECKEELRKAVADLEKFYQDNS